MTEPAHVLEARDVRFAYRKDHAVLDGVSLSAVSGSMVCLLGPNGSGKTTLLRCLLGRLTPSGGEIVVDGRPVRRYTQKALARTLAYVPQMAQSAFAFTIAELVLMGRYAHTGALGLAGQQDLDAARRAMERTGTLAFADRTLDELSGGEAQCVMIARALAQEPVVMLLDEPTSHLDIRNQLRIYRMMQRLAHEQQMAVVCVSHDVNLAARFADRLVLMREGNVVAAGPTADVLRPDVLQQTYGVEVKLINVEGEARPMVWAE